MAYTVRRPALYSTWAIYACEWQQMGDRLLGLICVDFSHAESYLAKPADSGLTKFFWFTGCKPDIYSFNAVNYKFTT